jgi:hypothetical protein
MTSDEQTGIFVMDMAPEGFAGRRYIVTRTTASPGMPLGPVAAGPFDSIEAAERESDELEAAHPLVKPAAE